LARRAVGAIATGIAVAATLCGCGIHIPADPDGTLAAVRGGELRVGTSPDDDLVRIVDGEPTGPVVDLVNGFAADLGARTDWTVASEESLVRDLEAGEIDLVAGGITSDTPWVDDAGVTRGYPGIPGSNGRDLVMLVPLGENAFLAALETYLDAEVGP
jgi:ABC-type amino acid transport substrate-binding protein